MAIPLRADAVAVRQAALDFASAVVAAILAAMTSSLQAVLARVVELVGPLRTALIEALSADVGPVLDARPPESGAMAILVGPMVPVAAGSRALTRPAVRSGTRAAGNQPARSGTTVRPVRQQPILGSFTAGPEEQVLSADLASNEREPILPFPEGRGVGVKGLAEGAPQDSLWAQTALLSLLVLLFLGAITVLRQRRRTVRDYMGYYRG